MLANDKAKRANLTLEQIEITDIDTKTDPTKGTCTVIGLLPYYYNEVQVDWNWK
jgi:hypothetical protein